MDRRLTYPIAGAAVAAPIAAFALSRRRKRHEDGVTDDTVSERSDRHEAARRGTARDGDKRRKRGGPQSLVRLIAVVLAIVAVVRELRLPPEQRTWHGVVAGVVPYDLRPPTVARIKAANWDPEGKLVGARAFGVGWTVNAGRAVKLVRDRLPSAA